jgi:hypothetical protein
MMQTTGWYIIKIFVFIFDLRFSGIWAASFGGEWYQDGIHFKRELGLVAEASTSDW